MTKSLIMATHNAHKFKEAKKLFPPSIELKSLADIGLNDPIPETGNTFDYNAFLKAKFVAQKLNVNCFADDSGLVVEALGGQPGIHSARYAGEGATDEENLQLLLANMEQQENRKAYFITVICLIWKETIYYFEGKINGKLLNSPKGSDGFGYDPIFIPEGGDKTFAEMTDAAKNKISHRAIAMKKLQEFLATQTQKVDQTP